MGKGPVSIHGGDTWRRAKGGKKSKNSGTQVKEENNCFTPRRQCRRRGGGKRKGALLIRTIWLAKKKERVGKRNKGGGKELVGKEKECGKDYDFAYPWKITARHIHQRGG